MKEKSVEISNWRRRFEACQREMGWVAGASLLSLLCSFVAYGQESKAVIECPDPAPETSGSHNFRRLGETIEIPVTLADCQAVSLELRWSNGRNNGSNFNITFHDTSNRVIYTKQIFGFMTGNFEFPFSSFYTAPYFGSRAMISVPATVTIEAVSPFARPASLSYVLTRSARHPRSKRASGDAAEAQKPAVSKDSLDYSNRSEGKEPAPAAVQNREP